MMNLTFFIFILVHIHFLNCTNNPEHLRCVDNLCQEIISIGRLIRAGKPEFGNLNTLKANTKVAIRGKHIGNENTLWLIESDGFYGFIDFSYIKEIKDNYRDDLSTYRNPYNSETVSDETEDIEESFPDETSTTDEIKPGGSNIENNDTENFSEDIQKKDDKMNIVEEHSSGNLDKQNVINDDIKLVNTKPNTINLSLNEQTKTMRILDESQNANLPKLNESHEIKNDDKINEKDISKNLTLETVSSELLNENQSFHSQNTEKESVKYNQESKEDSDKILNSKSKIIIEEPKQNVIKNIDKSETPSGSVKPSNTPQDQPKHAITDQVNVTEKENDTTIVNQSNINQIESKTNTKENIIQMPDLPKEPSKSFEANQEPIKKSPEIKENIINKEAVDPKKTDQETKSTDNSLNQQQETNENDSNVDKDRIQGTPTVIDQNKPLVMKYMALNEDKVPEEERKEPIKSETETNINITNLSHGDSKDSMEKSNSKVVNGSNSIDEKKVEIDSPTKDRRPQETNQQMEPLDNHQQEKQPEETSNISKSDSTANKIDNNLIKDQTKIDPENQEIRSESSPEKKDGKTNDSDVTNDKFVSETPSVNLESESVMQSSKKVELESPVMKTDDPWLNSGLKPGLDNDKETINSIRSPVIKLILKLDLLSQYLIKSLTMRLGLDSSSKISQFSNNWLQMSLENLLSISTLFVVLFAIVYTPKILKFNRDWKSEFARQSQIMAELESKLQSIEEVRHKLTVQNHNFEKVIDEYKQQINEIQDDAEKNKKTVIVEIAKLKKTHETNMKSLTNDFNNKVQQCLLLENDVVQQSTRSENLEVEMRKAEHLFEKERNQLLESNSRVQKDLDKTNKSVEQLKESLTQKMEEIEQLNVRIDELNQDLMEKSDKFNTLEKSFEHLKAFEDLNYEEYNLKKEICLDLSDTKEKLEMAEEKIKSLENDLNMKCQQIVQFEESAVESENKLKEYEVQKNDAVGLQEAAEVKLKVLSDYFKSKEVEMARTLGHQVIESTQTLDQVDYLKHRIQILETENEEMTTTVRKLKAEIIEVHSFAAKCKNDANEQINNMFIKSTNLERNLFSEREESKKLRTKLSHYCGPTQQQRNVNTSYNHNKDRPPSRQSMTSESSGFIPLPPMIPIPFLPQSPMLNSPMSGRNSVNSKKSNNT